MRDGRTCGTCDCIPSDCALAAACGGTPERRREGIGRRLVAAAEERFALLGGARATAMVLDGNDLAHRVWRARGHAPQTEWSRWVKTLP